MDPLEPLPMSTATTAQGASLTPDTVPAPIPMLTSLDRRLECLQELRSLNQDYSREKLVREREKGTRRINLLAKIASRLAKG
jgi:hypothetical protein